MRRSLLVRLVGLSLAVAVCSIAATAWLTTRETTQRINGTFERTLEADGYIYQELLAYAHEHPSWDGVDTLVEDLAKETDRRVTLTTPDGEVIADSAGGPEGRRGHPVTPAASIDAVSAVDGLYPLRAAVSGEGAMVGDVTVDAASEGGMVLAYPGVTPSALWRITPAEEAARRPLVEQANACLLTHYADDGVQVSVDITGMVTVDSGSDVAMSELLSTTGTPLDDPPAGEAGPRATAFPEVADSITSDPATRACIPAALNKPTAAAAALSTQLNELLGTCLDEAGVAYDVTVAEDGLARLVPSETTEADLMAVDTCARQAADRAYDPYLAPSADLYIDSSDRLAAFTGSGWWRTALTALAVLFVAAGITIVAGRRLVRPIQALTGAAQRMTVGDHTARVPVRGSDEVARLGHAFNAMAESVDSAERQRRAMVSDVAHELRTPLANVRGYLEAAQDGVVTLDRKLVSSLLEESTLLQRLVDDLQDLALADAGRLTLHPEECDLAELADQVVVGQRARADDAGVTLTLEATEPATLMADPTRLRQAVGNLGGNAIQYTPEGGAIQVVVGRADDEVRLTVHDTGPGIPPEALPHIFDRFYRVEKSRSRTTGGSGLGLAITKHLVENHGGSIEVTSTPGEGSSFTIRLPADGDAEARTPAEPATRA